MKAILYIEDSRDTADAVKILLSSAGFETDTAANGREGLQRSSVKKYDLYLLDIMLPDMSGWDIFEKLRKSQKDCKYAFLSAIPISAERLEELRKEGISDYITKPFKRDDLVNRIKKMLPG